MAPSTFQWSQPKPAVVQRRFSKMKFFSEVHSWDVNIDSGAERKTIRFRPESIFTSPRNPYSHPSGIVIHMPRNTHAAQETARLRSAGGCFRRSSGELGSDCVWPKEFGNRRSPRCCCRRHRQGRRSPSRLAHGGSGTRNAGCWNRRPARRSTRECSQQKDGRQRQDDLGWKRPFAQPAGFSCSSEPAVLPIKVVVVKNNTLGQIKWEQLMFPVNPGMGVNCIPSILRHLPERVAALASA
jgi:hypothetical protein